MKIMQQKWLCILLICAMLLPSLPIISFAIDRDDTTNIAAQDYEQDRIIMRESDGTNSASSGSSNKWNQTVNVSKANAKDPLDESNTVFSFTGSASKSGSARKNVLWDNVLAENEEIVIATDILLPSASEEGVCNDTVKFTLFGAYVLQFNYDTEKNVYHFEFDGKQYTAAPNQWMRYYIYLAFVETGVHAATIQLSGDLKDEEGTALSYIQERETITRKSIYFQMAITGKENCTFALYMDDFMIYVPGDFAPASVSFESLGDYLGNFDLTGKVTVKLYHDMDLSTFDIETIRLCDKLSADVPFTSVTLKDPATLVFDFSEHKLPKFTDLYVCFGDAVRDMMGHAMYEPSVLFTTRGDRDELPPPPEMVEYPEEGFVMPDRWNTGYRCAFSELVPIEEKYPEVAAAGGTITESVARKYNYEFSHFINTQFALRVTATSPVYIHDFYQSGGGIYNGKSGPYTRSARLTVAWGEGEGGGGDFFGGADLTISHCYVHDVPADHLKGTSGQIIEFNYFTNGGTRTPGAHADVIQFMGSTDSQGQNIKVYGNRFDVPPMKYDHLANCCFFFKPEANTQGYVNVQAIGNWFNGGGYTTYLTPACSVDKCPQLYYEHNRFGYGHQFGPIILNDAWKGTNGNHNLAATNGSYVDNGYVTTLQTGSVVYYNGEADEANRVFSIEDMTETDITVMVNLANYMTIARGYRISVEVLNAEGYAVASVVQSGEVRRYTPVKEYYVASNTQTITLPSGQTVEQLIEIPDFPQNVPAYITVNDLPADLAGHSISIKVYDETNGETKLIRTSLLSEDIYDHCRPEEDNSDIPEETTYTVTFQDADGHVISTQTVKAGQGATAPTAPQKEGYTFSGWSVDFSQVNGNLVVVAQYTKNETPPAEQSQELSDFIAAVEKAENTANADLSARLCAIYEADLLWWKIENIEEEGAREAYERFVLVLSLYNQDLKRINGVLQDAEDVASYLCGVPSEN